MPGSYQVFLHSGHGGTAGWSEPLPLEILKANPWPDTIYNVGEFGAARDDQQDDTDAIQAALNRVGEGGGGDREAMTSDTGGGAYAGALASADRKSIPLA